VPFSQWNVGVVLISVSETYDNMVYVQRIITFRVSCRRREMYSGHARLCVMPVCHVRGRMPTLLHGPGCNLGEWYGCLLVVYYWVGLQSVHGLRCYDNIARTRNVSECSVLALCLVSVC